MIATALDTTVLSDLAADLAEAGLPTSDLAEPGRRFFRFEDAAGIVGYVRARSVLSKDDRVDLR